MKKPVPAEMMAQNTSERWRQVAAYYIWEKEGYPHGRDLEHWYQASAQLADLSKGTKAATAKKSTSSRTAKKQIKSPVKKPPSLTT